MTDIIVACLAVVAGAFTWTFVEYALHAWVFHSKRGKTLFNREHLAHHARTSYFAPTRSKIVLASAVAALLEPVAILAVGALVGTTYAVGFIGAYTLYEIIHRRTHTHPPRGPYSRWARKHHLHHHFHSPKMNHGVTSPLWDLVFGTYERADVVTVPKRHVMSWLVDSRTGEVFERFARDYRVGRRGRATSVEPAAVGSRP